MQRTKFKKLFVIAVITASISGHAQQTPVAPERVGVESADALPLSLNEAIKLALENNNDIRTSRIDVEKAEYKLTATRGA